MKELKPLVLKPRKSPLKIGDICPAIEPNVHEDCLLLEPGGEVLGFFLKTLPPDLQNLVNIADSEVRSANVPKSVMDRKTPIGTKPDGSPLYRIVSQYSAILGSIAPKPHMRRPYASRSSVHSAPTAKRFVKAMLKAGHQAMEIVNHSAPAVYAEHETAIGKRLPEKWRFARHFSSTITNCNIAAPIHQDNATVKGAVNVIITKRRNSKGGNLYVPDYDACFDQTDNSMLVYPAWRNRHGVTPIVTTHQNGYRNSHVWYALDGFAALV